MKVLRLNSGASASVQLSPLILRIFTVCHFSPSLAAHSAAGSVTPSRVTGVAPAQIVLRIGNRGMRTTTAVKSSDNCSPIHTPEALIRAELLVKWLRDEEGSCRLSFLQFSGQCPVLGSYRLQLFDGVFARFVVSLQCLDRLQPNALNQSCAEALRYGQPLAGVLG